LNHSPKKWALANPGGPLRIAVRD